MIDAKKIQELEIDLQRIFALPIAKSSFRLIQNAILGCAEGNKELASRLLESLLIGNVALQKEELAPNTAIQPFIDRYTILVSTARDVAERGEFVANVTSDFINHPQLPLLGNRIRRIDGNEFEFLTDASSTLQLLQHFSYRLQELHKAEPSRKVLDGLKKELTALLSRIDQLVKASND